eukprot:1745856-Amphidinium_carterae.1
MGAAVGAHASKHNTQEQTVQVIIHRKSEPRLLSTAIWTQASTQPHGEIPGWEWTHDLGYMRSQAVATSSDGSVYIAGAYGSFPGETSSRDDDAFLVKFNSSGELEWTKQ